jgi:purine-binding chemotaxis protein CheW
MSDINDELLKAINKESVKTVSNDRGYRRHQLIVFKLGNEEYALPIDQIKEIVLTPPITKLPQTPDFIKGVANIRGNIIAIADLEEKFGVTPNTDEEERNKIGMYTLVIESDAFKIGILVKSVPNTLAASDDEIDDSPNVVHDSSLDDNYIKGIVKSDKRLIILIDIFKVIKEELIDKATKKA